MLLHRVMLTALFLWSMCIQVKGLLYPRHKFKSQSGFENTVCPTEDILGTQSVGSSILCSVICSQNSACRRFMYNHNLKVCMLCRGKYFFTQEFRSEYGYRHYIDQTRNYHLNCTSNSDCNEINNVCEERLHLCVCTPGYSYHPGTISCVAGCETYGSTFETYKQFYIVENNDDQRAGVSLEFSVQHCINAGFLCRSFEREGDETWFSSANALTHPDEYKVYIGPESYYYNRNCA